MTVLEYLDRAGTSPFAVWFRSLDATAAAKVTTALRRLELGNFSNVKGGSSSTATRIYEVVSGDSLSRIAKREYGNANDWKRIFTFQQ